MEPSKEAIAVRISRLNRQILGKVTVGSNKLKKTIDRESLLDALTVLYDECNDDPVKKCDDLVKAFVDKYRSTLAELRRTRVCLSDFDILQTIGRGHFGEVHMVREKHTSDVYALKTMRKEQARARAAAEDERDVLAACGQPWLPRLQYAFQDATNLYLVMELCGGGDLAGLLTRRSQPLAERDAAFYVAEVAHALKALHAMGFVHRDVKPHNILLDRCGHVKLGDLGSCVRLAGGAEGAAPVTADYVAPELLAAAHCAATHSVCLHCARGIAHAAAASACDYWSLGVVAFELVTLRRPFSSGDDDSIAQILANIQRYENDPEAEPPFDPPPSGPSREWRALVRGLLCVPPSRRYNYLDTLQHAALQHLAARPVRDQAPPWVPLLRGPEDAAYFSPPPRGPASPRAAPFRTRPPFAGHLPFIGYSYVAPDEHDDNSGGFNSSHDCTAINLATFKSAEKLAAMRAKEIASLQSKLAEAEAAAAEEAEKIRRETETETERLRARLQADITALSLQNRRLERQIEVEKEERMALERTNQELSMKVSKRNSVEARASQASRELEAERDSAREESRRLEASVAELRAECARAAAAADAARAQQRHYKDIIQSAQELRHRRLTEINVRAIDSIAKERALRRQTLTGGETESREAAARLANTEAQLAKETRAKEQVEKKLASVEDENRRLQSDLDEARRELARSQEQLGEKRRLAATTGEQAQQLQQQLAQERVRVSSLLAQVQELERGVAEAARREAALEEQCARTEARLHERLAAAEARAHAALHDDVRRREKVNTLEQLVRQLEREVSALESRATCPVCAARHTDVGKDAHSDTESVGDAAHAPEGRDGKDGKHGEGQAASEVAAQVTVLKEQLERAEAQLQARADEIAALRQEARTANLARWRKEREYNELSVEAKASARDVKRLEERLQTALEARKTAEQKANALQSEMTILKPQHEQASKDVEQLKEQLEKLQKTHESVQAEVDRSRNDIRKLKSELQYSEKRRIHAEEQEELSSRERSQICDELASLRAHNAQLTQNNKALQEACTLLEEQLTDLEKLTDVQELKNKDLESDTQRIRAELEACRARLREADASAARLLAAQGAAAGAGDEARAQLRTAHAQLHALRERLECREAQAAELESSAATLEAQKAAAEGALQAALRRVRELQEESAALRTRAAHQHAAARQLEAGLQRAQEELAAMREASDAATAWWRTRETKADATLRQQAKLIDFLQAKIEEAGRKKCSLSNRLFGRSGRRGATSPSMRRTNRELREEVERLRAKLASNSLNGDSCPPTPRSSTKLQGKPKSGMDATDSNHDENKLQIVWSDGTREKLPAQCSDGALVLTQGDRKLSARLHTLDAPHVPQNEANRAFSVKIEDSDKGCAGVVCPSAAERAAWVGRLSAPAASCPAYCPAELASQSDMPTAALYVGPGAIAIGSTSGLYSLRGAVQLELESEPEPEPELEAGVAALAVAGGRCALVRRGRLLHGPLRALGSALRRAPALRPSFAAARVALPDAAPPHLLKGTSAEHAHGVCAVAACARRVFALRRGAGGQLRVARSFTVDRAPAAALLTARALFIAGEKPLRIRLPAGAMESFAMDEPTVAAAAKKRSPPRAILLVRADPVEILLCYAECGVFLDEDGKRTRSVDPKWNFAVDSWEFVDPFLYLVGDERVSIVYVNEEAYNLPPCTCDAASVASTVSDCCQPETFTLTMKGVALLGTVPNGIIIRSKIEDGYKTSVIEGMAAFKSIGASVESLATISDKGSTTDLAQSDDAPSTDDISQHDVSRESVEATTGFLADIRKRAKQLRLKNLKEQSQEDVIKKILTNEVGLRPPTLGRKSPAMISEYDSDESSEEVENGTDTTQKTADLCAEMFTRQVRFQ